jgi:UDP-N-acetylmuramoyl-L-alanyl-D-glutamate--2,6-diaminopimelate ligase
VNILRQEFDNVLTNPTGANMVQGIVSTFLSAKKTSGKKFAVLEIDEASLSKVTEYIKPELFVFTNIFRDQMDRYGEIYTTYQLIVDGAAKSPNATILTNGDSPIFNSIDTINPRKYYGFDHEEDHEQMAHYNTDGVLCPKCQHILHYKMITYANLGKYYCPNCDFYRPELDYKLTELKNMTNTSAEFVIDGNEYKLEVGGMYNIYNALAATAVAEYYTVSPEKIRAGLGYDEKVFGRQEVIEIDGKQCTLVLVKNPVGLNQVIDMIGLSPYQFSLVCLLNANYADGIDVSWIWDGDHEAFAEMDIPQVIAGGDRHKDMALRLKVAGIAEEIITETQNLDEVIDSIKDLPTEHVYILATYTAVLQLRKKLADKGYMEGGMTRG